MTRRKFKIGDTIRVANPRSAWDRRLIGRTGKVIALHGEAYKVALNTGSPYGWHKYFHGRELEFSLE